MHKKNIFLFILVLIVVSCLLLIHDIQDNTKNSIFEISFLDVGQGDATLLTLEDGYQILIDTGKGPKVLRELGSVMNFSDKTIDTVILTHNDNDHTGGLKYLLKAFKIKNIIHSPRINRKLSYSIPSDVKEIIINNPSYLKHKDTELFFLWPTLGLEADDNSSSIIILVKNKTHSTLLLTGDANTKIEERLLQLFKDIPQIDILKAGHHGSKYSTGQKLLEAIKPQWLIISASENNPYGHPHNDVLKRVEKVSKVLMTSTKGSITFIASGDSFELKK